MIQSTLPSEQIDELLRLRNAMLAYAEENRVQSDDSADDIETAHLTAPVKTAENNKINIDARHHNRHPNDNDGGGGDGESTTAAEKFPVITRELLVRFLKLEKYRLQKMKKIRTISHLLEEYIKNNDLTKE